MFKAFREPQWRKRIGILVVEVFSVVLAVLLALAANDWRDKRTAQSLTKRSLTAIVQELKTNLDQIVQAHEHHGKILHQMRASYAENAKPSQDEAEALILQLYQSGIVKPGSVLDTAWSTAQTTGAVQGLDYEIALSISKAYAFQADYRSATEAMFHAMNLAAFLGTNPGDYLSGIYQGINDHWWLEERLIDAYKETLKML